MLNKSNSAFNTKD